MRKNISLIVLVAAIFVFVGALSNSAKAADDPVEAIRNAKTPVHLHSLAPGDDLVHDLTTWIGTTWHSLYPPATYCHVWEVIDERDNGIPGLNPSDKLKIEHVPDGSWIWVHVEDVTITLKLSNVSAPTETMYVEFSGGADSLDYPIPNPVSTWWHEVWPVWCEWWHIDAIDGGPPLQTCKIITINGQDWHVEDVATDLLVQSIPDPTVPTMTQWGVIILVVLIVGSAVFIMVRRRRVPVPA